MPAPNRPEIHGHRGCRGLYPENTLPAFLHALEIGVDVLEMDVVISADNQVVVSHEPWFNPLICLDPAGQPIPAGEAQLHNLFRLNYATIRQYDCGSQPHPGFPEQISLPCPKPLLREVFTALEAAALRLGRTPVKYSVEIKSSIGGDGTFHPSPESFLPLVVAELAGAGVATRSTLLCFDQRILRLAHQQHPRLATCLLVEDQRSWAAHIEELGFVPTAFGPNHTTVTAASTQVLRKEFPGLRLVPWTANTSDDILGLIRLGVDGITTDYPNRALSLVL